MTVPVVSVVGVSHRTAPVEVRERFAVGAAELPALLAELRTRFGAAVVLSTCNRTEVYTSGGGPREPATVVRLLSQNRGVPHERYRDVFFALEHQEAVRHLFRVACGIDSMVLGEVEILGQVRAALAAATEAGSLDAVTSRLFHAALAVGRRARSETDISRHAASVSSTSVALARQVLGDLSSHSVLVVSAGQAGKLVAKTLVSAGVSRVRVTNRNPARALEVAAELGGAAVPFERLAEAVAESDIVITSTGAPSFLIGAEMVRPAAAARNGRPLVLIDLAVPRDVDPAVRELPQVRLFDIDDLEAAARSNLQRREREVGRVEAVIEEEVERFARWWDSLDVVPTIAALRQRAEQTRRAELARSLARLPRLTAEERQRVEALTRALMKKLLHDPISRLRDPALGRSYTEAARELFGLTDSQTPGPGAPAP